MLWLLVACGKDAGDSGVTSTATASGASTPCAPGPQAVFEGELHSGDPAVVAVNDLGGSLCQRAGLPLCTGVVVGPTAVLTAAHCARLAGSTGLGVVLGDTAYLGEGPVGEGLEGVLFNVVSVEVHPDYVEGTFERDVALLTVDPPLDVAPVVLGSLPAEGLVGAPGRVVGYGRAGEVPADAKRTGTVRITEVGDSIRYVPEPAMTCTGDSGGPVFADEAGEERVVGITVSGDPDCLTHGMAVRIDQLGDFLP